MDDERKEILQWDRIHSEKPEDTLLNKPLRLLWAVKEILILFRAFVWHKKRSLRARRLIIDARLNDISRKLKTIEEHTENEHVEVQVRKSREDIQDIYTELELESYRRDANMPYDRIRRFEEEDSD